MTDQRTIMGFIDDLSRGQFDAKQLLELLGELLASVPEDLDDLPDE